MAHSGEFSETRRGLALRDDARGGGEQFFLYRGEAFAGDADLREHLGREGELAILIASRGEQGKGLGTRFAIMLHALAFRVMELERVYVTILPQNAASRRLFAKIGYAVDDSSEARGYVDEELDVSMSIGRHDFERAHAAVLAEIRITDEAA